MVDSTWSVVHISGAQVLMGTENVTMSTTFHGTWFSLHLNSTAHAPGGEGVFKIGLTCTERFSLKKENYSSVLIRKVQL